MIEPMYTYRDKDTKEKFRLIWDLLDYLPTHCPCVIERIDRDGKVEGEKNYLSSTITKISDKKEEHVIIKGDGETRLILNIDENGNRSFF